MYVSYDVRHSKSGAVLTAAFYGELDHHSATRLRAEIDAVCRRERPSVLELDLGGVDFMDSSGLGLVMGRLKLMRTLGGSLVILNASDDTVRILDMAGIDKFIKIEKKEISGI
ncbi:MAG TPA: anti-sigma factor antagonist [Bacillota bacterium]|nr:anti-sigma factor antagonist [Bacillota bacterium]